jgi:hypothetical protein
MAALLFPEAGFARYGVKAGVTNKDIAARTVTRRIRGLSCGAGMGPHRPIVIESRDDFKSEFRWKDRLEPFHHQVQNLITFAAAYP